MSAVEPSRLKLWDYVTFIVIIILASCIGIYHAVKARKSKNAREFLVRSHDLGILPLILSTAATFLSAIGILGLPTESYNNGASFMPTTIGSLISVPFGVYLYLPIFFNLQVTSIYEYLEFRFNRLIRICASSLINLQLLLYTSCVIYAPALALNQVTGLHLWASVASIGIICIIYTSMGGIKAVVWADVTQVMVMAIVLLIILFKGIAHVGGITELWRICVEGKRGDIFVFTNSEYSAYTTWTHLFGGSTQFLAYVVTNQLFMQRYLCNRTLKGAQISFIGANCVIAVLVALNAFGGLLLYARYHDCDPFLNGQVTSRDQIMALFAMEILSFMDGLPGLFVAAILCATLSTLSSTLNSLATVIMEDYIKPIKKDIPPAKEMLIAKLLAAILGVLCLVLVLFAERISGLIKTMYAIQGLTAGPVFTVFTMGILIPWINSKGATVGFLSGILLIGWASVGSLITNPTLPSAPIDVSGCNITSNASNIFNTSDFQWTTNVSLTTVSIPTQSDDVLFLYKVFPLWYPCWSLLVGTLIAVITSIFTGIQNPEELDSKLVAPFVMKFCRSLPERWQETLGFKVKKAKYVSISLTEPDHFGIDGTGLPIESFIHSETNLNNTKLNSLPKADKPN